MRLRDFLRADFVVLRLTSNDVEGIVQELATCAAEAGVGDERVVGEKLLERERLHPTAMGSGLAIPHATVPGLDAPVIGVALAPHGVVFGGPDSDPVRVFFVVLSPAGHEREHVKILARICRLARHPHFIEQLAETETSDAVVSVIGTVDDQHV